MKISIKITLSAAIITIGSSILLATLLHIKYGTNLQEIVSDRYNVLAVDVKDTIESIIQIGIRFDDVPSVQNKISQLQKNNKEIISIKIFEIKDDKGISVFDTRSAGIGSPIPQKWLNLIKETKKESILIKDVDSNLIGISFRDNFNVPLGGLIIRYDKAEVEKKILRHRAVAIFETFFTCLLGILLLLVLFNLIFKKFNKIFSVKDEIFSDTKQDYIESPLTESFNRLSSRLYQIENQLNTAEQILLTSEKDV